MYKFDMSIKCYVFLMLTFNRDYLVNIALHWVGTSTSPSELNWSFKTGTTRVDLKGAWR